VPTKLTWIWLAGLVLRLIAINFAGTAPDFVGFRLPIAQCLSEGNWLYCDCTYDHTPFYPYLSSALYQFAGSNEHLQVFLINLPLGIGDSLVPIVIFLLLSRAGKQHIAFLASAIYAFNPISFIEVGISHWDGFTSLFFMLGMLAMQKDQNLKVGFWAGMGFLLKQYPLGLFPVLLFKTKNFKVTFFAGLVAVGLILLILSPFLIRCSGTFVENMLNHPVWAGGASEGVGIGTLKNVFDHINLPYAKIVWGIIFLTLLIIPSFKANKDNYLYYAGILLVTLAFFTFVTHRQLLVWCMPFVILITLERKAYVPFVLFFVGYAIRIIKPDWYFGLIHLGVGAWYYVALLKQMNAATLEAKSRETSSRTNQLL